MAISKEKQPFIFVPTRVRDNTFVEECTAEMVPHLPSEQELQDKAALYAHEFHLDRQAQEKNKAKKVGREFVEKIAGYHRANRLYQAMRRYSHEIGQDPVLSNQFVKEAARVTGRIQGISKQARESSRKATLAKIELARYVQDEKAYQKAKALLAKGKAVVFDAQTTQRERVRPMLPTTIQSVNFSFDQEATRAALKDFIVQKEGSSKNLYALYKKNALFMYSAYARAGVGIATGVLFGFNPLIIGGAVGSLVTSAGIGYFSNKAAIGYDRAHYVLDTSLGRIPTKTASKGMLSGMVSLVSHQDIKLWDSVDVAKELDASSLKKAALRRALTNVALGGAGSFAFGQILHHFAEVAISGVQQDGHVLPVTNVLHDPIAPDPSDGTSSAGDPPLPGHPDIGVTLPSGDTFAVDATGQTNIVDASNNIVATNVHIDDQGHILAHLQTDSDPNKYIEIASTSNNEVSQTEFFSTYEQSLLRDFLPDTSGHNWQDLHTFVMTAADGHKYLQIAYTPQDGVSEVTPADYRVGMMSPDGNMVMLQNNAVVDPTSNAPITIYTASGNATTIASSELAGWLGVDEQKINMFANITAYTDHSQGHWFGTVHASDLYTIAPARFGDQFGTNGQSLFSMRLGGGYVQNGEFHIGASNHYFGHGTLIPSHVGTSSFDLTKILPPSTSNPSGGNNPGSGGTNPGGTGIGGLPGLPSLPSLPGLPSLQGFEQWVNDNAGYIEDGIAGFVVGMNYYSPITTTRTYTQLGPFRLPVFVHIPLLDEPHPNVSQFIAAGSIAGISLASILGIIPATVAATMIAAGGAGWLAGVLRSSRGYDIEEPPEAVVVPAPVYPPPEYPPPITPVPVPSPLEPVVPPVVVPQSAPVFVPPPTPETRESVENSPTSALVDNPSQLIVDRYQILHNRQKGALPDKISANGEVAPSPERIANAFNTFSGRTDPNQSGFVTPQQAEVLAHAVADIRSNPPPAGVSDTEVAQALVRRNGDTGVDLTDPENAQIAARAIGRNTLSQMQAIIDEATLYHNPPKNHQMPVVQLSQTQFEPSLQVNRNQLYTALQNFGVDMSRSSAPEQAVSERIASIPSEELVEALQKVHEALEDPVNATRSQATLYAYYLEPYLPIISVKDLLERNNAENLLVRVNGRMDRAINLFQDLPQSEWRKLFIALRQAKDAPHKRAILEQEIQILSPQASVLITPPRNEQVTKRLAYPRTTYANMKKNPTRRRTQ